MTDPSYSWFYEEPFHSIFLISTTSLSLLSNGLLLYIIYTTNSTSIGPYRYLLAVFAVSDIASTAGHAAYNPYVHMTSSGFYFFPRHGKMIIAGRSFDTIFALVFIATYYQTFLVLAYHYVYRFKTVSRGMARSFTDSFAQKQWIIIGVIIYVLYIACFVGTCAIAFTPDEDTRALVPQEIMNIYGIELRDPDRGFTVIAVRRPFGRKKMWHLPSVISLALLLVMFGGTAFVIIYCIWKINDIIRSSDNHLTARTRKMQMDLFNALLIQTAIPVFFSYVPLSTVLIFPPITGISLAAFGNVLLSITSIFPSVDALFVLYFITRFRIAVIRLFRLPFYSNSGTSVERPTDSRSVGTKVPNERVRAVI